MTPGLVCWQPFPVATFGHLEQFPSGSGPLQNSVAKMLLDYEELSDTLHIVAFL